MADHASGGLHERGAMLLLQPFLQKWIGGVNHQFLVLDNEPSFPAKPMIELALAD